MSHTINVGANTTNRRGRGRSRGNQHTRNTNPNNFQYNSQQRNFRVDYTSKDFNENQFGEEDWKAKNSRGNWRGRGRNDFKNNSFKREARSHSSSSSSSSRNENMNKVHSNNYPHPQGGRMFGTDSSRLPSHSQTPIFANEIVHNFNSIMPPSELLSSETSSFVQPRSQPPLHIQSRIVSNQGDNGCDLTFASISSNVSQGFRHSRSRSPERRQPLRDDRYQARFHPSQDGNPRERFSHGSGDMQFEGDARLHSGPQANNVRCLPPYIDKTKQPVSSANIDNRFTPNSSVDKARRNQILMENGFKYQVGQNHVNRLDPLTFQNPSGYAGRNNNRPLLDLPIQFDNNIQGNNFQGVAPQSYDERRNVPLQDPRNTSFDSHSGKGLAHAVAGGPFNIRSPAGNPHQPHPSRSETVERIQAEHNAKAAEYEAKQREKEAKKREQKLAKYKYVDQGHYLTDPHVGEAAGYAHGFGLVSQDEARQRQQEQLNQDALHFRDHEREEIQERTRREEEKRQKELVKKSKFVDAGHKLGYGGNQGYNRGGRQRRTPKANKEGPGLRNNEFSSHSGSPTNPKLLEGESLEDQLQLEALIYSDIARQKEERMSADQQRRNSTDKFVNKGTAVNTPQSYKPGHQGQLTPQVPPVANSTKNLAPVVETAPSNASVASGSKEAKELEKQLLGELETLMAQPNINATVAPDSKEAKELEKQMLGQLEALMAKPSSTPEESSCTTPVASGVLRIPSQGPEDDAQQASVSVTQPIQSFPSSEQLLKRNVTVPPVNKEAQEREILLRKLLEKCFMKIPTQTTRTPVGQEANTVQNSTPQFDKQEVVNAEIKNQKAEETKKSKPKLSKNDIQTTNVAAKNINLETEKETKNTELQLAKNNIQMNIVNPNHLKQKAKEDKKNGVAIRENQKLVEKAYISNPQNQIQETESMKPASCVLNGPSQGAVLVLRPTEQALQRTLSSRLEVQDEIDKQGYSTLYKPTVHEPPQYLNNRFERQPFLDTAKATGAVPKQVGLTQNAPKSNLNPSTSASETTTPEPVIDHQAEMRAARLRMQQQYEESLKKQQENSPST